MSGGDDFWSQVMTLTLGVFHYRHGLCNIKWLRTLAVGILWLSIVAQVRRGRIASRHVRAGRIVASRHVCAGRIIATRHVCAGRIVATRHVCA
eukprot:5496842-Pyramimonas_sp.AAC.2